MGYYSDDNDIYELQLQRDWQRRLKRNCQGGPDCGCAWCEPEPEEETEVNEQDE